MFETEWPVLVVDDEPDILTVSKLAMKNFRIDGQPDPAPHGRQQGGSDGAAQRRH